MGEEQGERTCAASSRRLRLFQAGPMSRKTAGVPSPSALYQPMPKPSPLVDSTPIRAWRLWLISECSGR